MSSGGDVENIPLNVVVVVLHVDAPGDDERFIDHRSVAHVLQIHLLAIVCPGAELHEAFLHVEGKEFHVYGAVALVDRWRFPHYFAVVVNRGLCLQSDDKVSIGAKRQDWKDLIS